MFKIITQFSRRFPMSGRLARAVFGVIAVLSVIALAAQIYFWDEFVAFLTRVTGGER